MVIYRRTRVGLALLLVWAFGAFSGFSQAVNGTQYQPIVSNPEAASDDASVMDVGPTPQYTRAIGARFQSAGLRKIEDFLRNDGFSSQSTGRVCFRDRADCYRDVEVCLHYDIKFNNRADLLFRPGVGPNGALEVNLAIKRPHNGSGPFDLTNIDVRLRNPSGIFSWCSLNPLRSFSNGRVKFSENGSTPGLTVNLLVEPVLQGGVFSIRKVGGSGVRINRMYLQFSGWPDWLINWIFNLGFVRNALASTIETQTINALNGYLRDLFRFQGGFEGFSYNFLPTQARVDGNGLNMYFNGGVNYLQPEADCTAGRAPWPSEPGMNPASTIETFHADKDLGLAIRTVLANNALREAYNRGVFCYKNDASPFRVADLCGAVPLLCTLLGPQAELYLDLKLWPPDLTDPEQMPRIEITQPGPDGRLTVRFNNLNVQAFARGPDVPQWQKFFCMGIDASVEARMVFSGSAVFLRLGSDNTQVDNYYGALLPDDIEACTGGLDITKVVPPDDIEQLIREFLIPYFNNTVGQIPFSTNIFSFGCYRVFANGYGLGGEYANIYASFLKARDLPTCAAAGGRTTLEIFNGPAEGSYTGNRRPSFWARAGDPRGEVACANMRYASGFDGPLGAYAAASACPLGIYMTSPSADLPDGEHVFRIQAKTLAVPGDACLPSGRPECLSLLLERRFIVDTTPPDPPSVMCPANSRGTSFVLEWSAGSDAMTPPERLRYLWFVEDLRDGNQQLSFGPVSDAERQVTLGLAGAGGPETILQPGATYEFWVRTVDQAGNVSAESNRCRFTTN